MGDSGTSTARTLLGRATAALLVVTLLALLAGHVLGVPILLSYVETGSMEPTLEAGDGFVAIPTASADSVEEGDVVVFDATEIEGGGLTTHRVVDETEHGYVTKGDANPFTDQDAGEPYVTDGQVVAKAWQVDGGVVAIPHLGTAAMGIQNGLESLQWWLAGLLGTRAVLGTQGLAYLLMGAGLVTVAVSVALDRGRASDRVRSRTRSRGDVFDARTLVLGLGLLLCLVTFGTMIAMSGTTEIGIVSAEFDSERPDVIPAGETDAQTYELHNAGALPVVTIVEPASDGIAVDADRQTLHRGESLNATVSITAPPETGYYLRSFAENRYFAVLPVPVIAGLHAVHPWVAMAAVTGVTVSLFLAPFALLLGAGTIRTRTRQRSERPGGILR